MPGLKRKLDYSDYAATPDDGKRYEIIDGELYSTSSPGTMHQRVSGRLVRQLDDYFEPRGIGEIFHAPIDLILGHHDIFVPDILVVGDPASVTHRAIEGPPQLVVEILSPSTRAQDCGVKARRYAELGIRHYWIVDPEERRIEFHRLTDGGYRCTHEARGDGTVTDLGWDGLTIDLTTLWRSL
jgi:Uma2 family endonuclease